MAPYGLGLELGMTSIAVAVADGTSVQVIPASADSANPEVPAVVYAAHGRFLAHLSGDPVLLMAPADARSAALTASPPASWATSPPGPRS